MNTQCLRVVDDVQSEGRLVIRDCAGAARAGLILGCDLRGGCFGTGLGSVGVGCVGIGGGGFGPGCIGIGCGRSGGLGLRRGRGSVLRGRHVGCLRAFVGGAGSHGEGGQRRDEKRESGQAGGTRNAHTGAERTQSRHRLLLLWAEYGQDGLQGSEGNQPSLALTEGRMMTVKDCNVAEIWLHSF